jgi:acyl carrier protein
MSNIELYKKVFIESFEVEENLVEDLAYQGVPLWDSIGHMGLISNLEETFDLIIDTDDIIALSDYKIGMSILTEKYGVNF